jgi:hypothetical protein
MTSTSDRLFDPLDRPDRYDDRLDTERYSEAASRAACGVESICPQGYRPPTAAEIRQQIADHARDMQIGLAWMRSLDHLRHNPESFRRYLLSPRYKEDHARWITRFQRSSGSIASSASPSMATALPS